MIGSVYHGFVFVNKYFGEEGVSTMRGKREEVVPEFGQEREVGMTCPPGIYTNCERGFPRI